MYVEVKEDWDGAFGTLVAASKALPTASLAPGRTSVARLYQRRRPENFPLRMTKKLASALREHDKAFIGRVTKLRNLRSSQFRGYALLVHQRLPGAFGATLGEVQDALQDQWLGWLAAAKAELQGLDSASRINLGVNSLVARAATIGADFGLDVTRRDVVCTAITDLLQKSGRYLEAGSAIPQGLAELMLGDRLAAVFNAERFPITRALGGAASLEALSTALSGLYGDLGSAWHSVEGSARTALSDLSAMAATGFRRFTEQLQESGVGRWLTEENLSRAWGLVLSVADSVESGSPGAITRAGGSVLAMAGGLVGGPAGMGLSVAGAAASIIGGLIALFEAEEPPPPEALPCDPRLDKIDAWHCLTLFLLAEPERFGLSPTRRPSVAELVEAGWDVQIDSYTGEVHVRVPGSRVYRRILDVFDRQKLLDSFLRGGSVAYFTMEAPFISASDLWCLPQPTMNFTRFLLAERTSQACRLRVPYESGRVNRARLLNQRVVDLSTEGLRREWQFIAGMPPDEGIAFRTAYAVASFASAYLGGAVPYGIYKGIDGAWGRFLICTGVGGQLTGEGGEETSLPPFALFLETGSHLPYLVPPESMKDVLATKSVKGRGGLIALGDLPRVIADESLRVKYRIPLSSPPVAGDPHVVSQERARQVAESPFLTPEQARASQLVALRTLTSSDLDEARRRIQKFKSGREVGGLSSGAKVALVVGGLALVGGTGWLYYRSRRGG